MKSLVLHMFADDITMAAMAVMAGDWVPCQKTSQEDVIEEEEEVPETQQRGRRVWGLAVRT